MNLSSFVSKNMVTVSLRSNTKRAVIAEIVGYICTRLSLSNKNEILQSVLDREEKASTGIGDGVAIPHARLPRLDRVLFFVGISKPGIDFGAADGKVSHIIFLFVTPETESQTHLKILSSIGNLQKNSTLIDKLIRAESDLDLFDILNYEQVQRESYYPLSREEVCRELETSQAGLSEYEARTRLEIHGPNRLLVIGATPLIRRFFRNLADPANLSLLVAAVIAYASEHLWIASILLFLTLLNASLDFLREFRRDRAVDALRTFIPQVSTVIREGRERSINTENLVPGDVLLLDAGDVIPADGRLIEADELRVDNSAFSGDPKPVYKSPDPVRNREQFLWIEIPALVFAGTKVIAGAGKVVVTSTGMDTELGQIAYLTQTIKSEPSGLQTSLNRFGWATAVGTLGLLVIAALLQLLFHGLGGEPTPKTVLAAIGIILGLSGAGIAPAISVVLLRASLRLRKKGVIIKRLSSIEELGATNAICTDKTGTLTENEMSVRRLWLGGRVLEVGGEGYDPRGGFQEGPRSIQGIDLGNSDYRIFFYDAVLCNNAELTEPSEEEPKWHVVGDPTEGALLALARKAEIDVQAIREAYPAIRRFPFDSVRKRMSTVHRVRRGRGEREGYHLLVKGAPHELLRLSTKVLIEGKERTIDEAMRKSIDDQIDRFAGDGMRVLGFAYRRITEKQLEGASVEQVEQNLVFTGVTAMIDPPRRDAREAISLCRQAGIRIIMITGEYQLTALSIARKLGIVETPDARVITGRELSESTDEELTNALGSEEIVFARVNPEHRLRIVRVLEQMGYFVAATGDGISDAPVLKRASIGVAMGKRGNPVTRATAEMILSEDSFAGIVAAIDEGRTLFANVRRMIGHLSSHLLPQAISFVAFLLLSIPLPLTLALVLLIDLLVDFIPALTLGTLRPVMAVPAKRSEVVDNRLLYQDLLLRGALVTVVSSAGFFFALLRSGTGLAVPGTASLPGSLFFLGIVVAQLALFISRMRRSLASGGRSVVRVAFAVLAVCCSVSLVALATYVPAFQGVFHTTPLAGIDWIAGAVMFALAYGVGEIGNLVQRKRRSDK